MNQSTTPSNDSQAIWLPGVRRCPSPNCDDRPVDCDVELLVIHGISLPPSQYGGGYIDRLFTNSLAPEEDPYFATILHLRVSSHLLIDREGELTQYVPLNLRAWHAGESHYCGRHNCNDFSIGIELEGCDDDPYTVPQYNRLATTTVELMRLFPGLAEERIVGHSDIAPGRKTDPGKAFDWQRYFDLLHQQK